MKKTKLAVTFFSLICFFMLLFGQETALSGCAVDIEVESIVFAFKAPDTNVARDWGSCYPYFSEWNSSDRYMPDIFDVVVTVINKGSKTVYNIPIEITMTYQTTIFREEDVEALNIGDKLKKTNKEKEWKKSLIIRKLKTGERKQIRIKFDFNRFSNKLIEKNLWPSQLEFLAKANVLPGECNIKNNFIAKTLLTHPAD